MKKTKKTTAEKKSATSRKLKNIDLRVNEFGQVVHNIEVDQINTFLDEHVPDKKFDGDISLPMSPIE